MFCPKCGTQNPSNGRFCRSCGTDLGNVSEALSGKLKRQDHSLMLHDRKGKPIQWEGAITKIFTGIAFLAVTIALSFSKMGQGWWFWMLIPAFATLGSGIAQYIQLKKFEKGQYYNPNDELLNSEDITLLLPNQKDFNEIRTLALSGNKIQAIKLFHEKANVGLKTAKEMVEKIEQGKIQYPAPSPAAVLNEYAPPQPSSIYNTGELERVPPSVTEDTTRHLEINTEGETMTLPPSNKI